MDLQGALIMAHCKSPNKPIKHCGTTRHTTLHGFVGEEAVVMPVNLAEVPSLHGFTWYWGHNLCSSHKGRPILKPKELLRHISVREPVVWSGTRKGQIRIGSSVPAPGDETHCTLSVVEQH